jgi:hypothetical protein
MNGTDGRKFRVYALADSNAEQYIPNNDSSPLGLLPHQIRGFLGQFSNMLIAGKAYDRCTACSETVSCNINMGMFRVQIC